MTRLRKEWATLSSGSCVPPGVFIRLDEVRLDCARVLIVGPSCTPYEDGLFLFDVLFPCDYPQRSPVVQFLTTGGGVFRFNPNLYADGKVCLSLLGTWQGQAWDARYSTLLQLLVSIQSMIFVQEPFYNEPGWERLRSTPDGQRAAAAYNRIVRRGTVKYALLDALRDTRLTLPFAHVVRQHCNQRASNIVQRTHRWIDDERCSGMG